MCIVFVRLFSKYTSRDMYCVVFLFSKYTSRDMYCICSFTRFFYHKGRVCMHVLPSMKRFLMCYYTNNINYAVT